MSGAMGAEGEREKGNERNSLGPWGLRLKSG